MADTGITVVKTPARCPRANAIEGAAITADELLFEPELVVRGSTGPAVAARSAEAARA